MRGMIVCDKVSLSVVSTSRCSCQSSLVDETAQFMIYDNGVSFGESVFRQIRRVQRRPHPAFAIFQVPTAQNEVAKWQILRWRILLLFSSIYQS